MDPDRVADALLPRFFAVWEDDTTFVALLRAAMTSATAADTMRKIFATQVAPKLSAVTPDNPAQRAGLMGAFIIGLATTRYVLTNPFVASLATTSSSRGPPRWYANCWPARRRGWLDNRR